MRRCLGVLWGEHGDAFSDVFGVWLLWALMSQTGCRYSPAKLRTKVLRSSAVLSFQLSVVSSVVPSFQLLVLSCFVILIPFWKSHTQYVAS